MAFESLSQKLAGAFKKLKSKGKLTEQDIKLAMREVRIALLEADVNITVAKNFINTVSERAMGAEVMGSLTPAQQVIKIVNEELTNLMGSQNQRIKFANKGPTVIMMCGLQGAGKTTHCAKLAKMYLKQGHRPMIAALDIYRPAAIEQLEIVAGQAGAPVFQLGKTDPAVIAKKAYNHARDYGNDILILDTAGRLHIDEQLMAELTEIKNTIDVTETLLVIDAMAGQDAVNVAKQFNETIGLDGVIVTKLDGDTRGGSALSVKAVTGKPIKFIGTGEKLDDLEPFHPDRMASRILGMGDVLSLIEKASEVTDEESSKNLVEKMKSNKFDMNDMLEQLKQVNKMGGISSMLSMIPGAGSIKSEDEERAEKELKQVEAIINSMTKKEREKPSIIDPKRKRRIAAGSGTTVPDVNRLLKQFDQMQKIMKQVTKNPKAFARMMRGH
ncbi:MAG: signal recognition particle protein [Oscillospiraceae bacterium]|nr:signal recognition particle protein [Oscillospiraceae bacterium]MBP1552812.1 signal recognition particle protein [Oscillospiraceae bacterium]MBP1571886.1 signal recognition particle protein [Oscillospiraceae bacterium]MBQ5312617.1 signal recognition particle protein [Oscillospiraceae bacterium]MBQ7007250.1 signal recognition particle protein [Oscillospiraceae bacterium]